MDKQKVFRNKGRKLYWGVLAPEVAHKALRNPEHFMSLLQAQDHIAGKLSNDKPGQSSEDITI